jgi:hypothetical protein
MRRFALGTFGRLVHLFLPPGGGTLPRADARRTQASPRLPIERLHVERAHAAAHPIHVPPMDLRSKLEFVTNVQLTPARRDGPAN